MERTIRRFGPRREGRRLALWTPIDEQIERCLQTTGAGVRTVLAQRRFLDLTVEVESIQYTAIKLVRKGGFEPPRLSAPPPQDGVSASSTTSAH